MNPHSNKKPIVHRLKIEMKKRGIASTGLAKLADVKTSFLYDVISGKSANPSTVKLARVAQSLGVSLAYLVGGEARHEADRVIGAPGAPVGYVSPPQVALDT